MFSPSVGILVKKCRFLQGNQLPSEGLTSPLKIFYLEVHLTLIFLFQLERGKWYFLSFLSFQGVFPKYPLCFLSIMIRHYNNCHSLPVLIKQNYVQKFLLNTIKCSVPWKILYWHLKGHHNIFWGISKW